jgi:outer membrane receptor for Fe3+-dicitrate
LDSFDIASVSNVIPGLIVTYEDTNGSYTYGSVTRYFDPVSSVYVRTIALSNTVAWSNHVAAGTNLY